MISKLNPEIAAAFYSGSKTTSTAALCSVDHPHCNVNYTSGWSRSHALHLKLFSSPRDKTRCSFRINGTRPARGMFIPLVMGVLAFLFLIIFAFSFMVQSNRRSVFLTFKKEVALGLADAGIEQASAYFSSRESSLYGDLVDPSVPTSTLAGTSEAFSHTDFPYLESVVSQYEASVDVVMVLQDFTSIWSSQHPFGVLRDMNERAGKILIKATVTYAGVQWVKEVRKEIVVVNLLPAVLPKFTLFVKDRLEDSQLNVLENDKFGAITGPPSRQPVIVYNHPEGSALPDICRRGWIFLGGGKWNFNLTSGWGSASQSTAEDFHYLDVGRVCLIDGSRPGHGELGAYHLAKLLQRGFYDGSDMAAWMNPVASLSNTIHLFGDRTRQSPTLVLGRAYRRLAQYGAICWKDDPPSTAYPPHPPKLVLREYSHDEFTTALPANALEFPKQAPFNDDYPDPVNPYHVKPHFFNTSEYGYTLPGNNHGYAFYMSRVIGEDDPDQGHYNNSYDIIHYGTDNLFPGRELTTDRLQSVIEPPSTSTDQNYFYSLVNGNEPSGTAGLTIKRDDGTVVFKGNPGDDVDTSFGNDLKGTKAVMELSPGEFTAMFIRAPEGGGSGDYDELHLGTVIHVTGPLSLDQDLVVKDGGIIVTDGTVGISKNIISDSSLPPQDTSLVVCSLNGDILISSMAGIQVHAALIALNGKLNKVPGSPLEVKGSVAVGSLGTGLFSADSPGKIEYDPRYDPLEAGNYGKYYRANLIPVEITSKFYREM